MSYPNKRIKKINTQLKEAAKGCRNLAHFFPQTSVADNLEKVDSDPKAINVMEASVLVEEIQSDNENENTQTEHSLRQATIFCDKSEHLKDITPTKSTVESTPINMNMYKGFYLNPASIIKQSDNALIKYNTVEKSMLGTGTKNRVYI